MLDEVKCVSSHAVTIGNQIVSIVRFGNDKNLCIFFLLLSNVIGIGRAVARVSRLTFLMDCRMLIKIFNNRYSARLN
jgi:hypothetical protein